MADFFEDVNQWHKAMGLDYTQPPHTPHLLSFKEFRHRTNFIFEEFRELIAAHESGNLPETADAIIDMVWVLCGMAALMGIPLNPLWDEVKRANYTKRPWREGDPIKPRNYTASEIVKPEGWKPPNIRGLMIAYKDWARERCKHPQLISEFDGCMCNVGTGLCPIHGVE